jgi:hypothetical protein
MKRWRVVHFTNIDEAESYLNGLSLQPDQIKGLFAQSSMPTDTAGGMVLVCWLNAQQQRIEELQQRPLADEDNTVHLDGNNQEAWSVESEPPTEEGPRASRRRGEDDDAGA